MEQQQTTTTPEPQAPPAESFEQYVQRRNSPAAPEEPKAEEAKPAEVVDEEAPDGDEGEDEGAAEEPEKPEESGAAKRKPGSVKRHERLLREMARAAKLESELQQLKAKYEPEPSGPPPKPQIQDFETVEAFAAAMEKHADDVAEYKAQQKLKATAEEQRRAQIRESLETQFKETALQHQDFNAKVGAIPQEMWQAPGLVQFFEESGSEHLGELAYWLASRPTQLADIAGLPPNQAAIRLARIEAQISTARPGNAPEVPVPETKPATTAPRKLPPPPVKPLAVSAAPPLEKQPSEMTFEEYRQYRERRAGQ